MTIKTSKGKTSDPVRKGKKPTIAKETIANLTPRRTTSGAVRGGVGKTQTCTCI